MRKPFFRSCSLFLALVLLANMLPMSIFAEEFKNHQATAAEAVKDAQIVAEVVENRTEYTKEFKLDNGLFTAAVYSEPVHFLQDGQWQDIDNTLKASTDGVFINTAGVWDVLLPQQLSKGEPISIIKDGYTLSFQMGGELRQQGNLEIAGVEPAEEVLDMDVQQEETLPAETEPKIQETIPLETVALIPSEEIATVSVNGKTQTFAVKAAQTAFGRIQAVDLTEAKESVEYEEFILEKNSSQLLYANVYQNTNVQYDLQGNTVKESIILNSYSSTLRGYRYTLNVGDMLPVLNDDGSIYFYDENKENIVMVMPAPYLVDAAEECNTDVRVSLTGGGDTYTLVYLLPTDWLASSERAWPVVLDPVVNADVARSNIQDISIAEVPPSKPNNMILECGYHSGKLRQRFYVQYVDIPDLTSSDVIVEAKVQLIKAQKSNLTAPVVEVHKVLGTWDQSTINWSNQPQINPLAEDFNITKSATYYTWDITDIVRDWYSIENTGMVFQRDTDGDETHTEDWQQFYSSEYAWNTNRPYLTITYRNNNGIEDYWNYSTASAGRAGTGYVNTYTGNLTWIRGDIGFGGNRMPVSVSHAYNLNDSAENTYGMGYGWRTNFNQKVYSKTISSKTYYVWEDGDGTDHYFAYSSYATYKDEDGLNLTLKTNGSGTKKYSIADRQGNTTYFDTNGRMTYQENNQKTKSSIKLTYIDTTGNLIDYIKDGADRTYDFIYEDGSLSSICYLGTGTEPIHTVEFAYTDGNLTQVSYADEEDCYYTYDQNRLLTSASDIDGYKLAYTYNITAGDYQPYRVGSVTESCGGTLGGSLTFSYAHNQTTLKDHNNNVEILQFNNYGNTVCIQDDEGRAQYSQYAVNDASETGKANQLRLSSKLQNTVSNYCWGTSFEDSANSMTKKDDGTGTLALTSDQAYIGSSSLALNGELTVSADEVVIPAGETMTFSAYVKPNGSQVSLILGDAESQTLSGTGDWTRLEVAYTNTGETDQNIYPGIETTGTGDAFIDCIQLETNPTASRYNLIENGDFRAGNSNWYTGDDLVAESKLVDKEPATAQLSGKVYHAIGTPTGENRISQTVNVSGKQGDTFVLTGWAKGDAVPTPKASSESNQRYYGIIGKFNYTDTSKKSKTFVAKFNPDTDSTVNWQYSAEMMVAEYDYSSITVYIAYDRSANEAWFDGIQLFKEEFGHSYTYNSDGDVTSVKDLQNENTEYKYDSRGNVTQVIQDDKTMMTYTYDSYNNLTKSKSIVNVEYQYTYDDYGNNTTVSLVNGTSPKITTTVAYTSDGNRIQSNTDSLGRVTLYNYDENTNLLLSTQYPEDTEQTATVYTYDTMYRMATAEATTDTGLQLSAEYTYADDYLTAIETQSTVYGFTYNSFGLRSTVTAGDHTLATYNYTQDRNFYLQSLDYGNGDKVQYEYDDKGRMTKQTYEDGDTVTYHYDNYGALASVTDSATGRTTTNYYDFTDRLMKYVESGNGYNHSLSYEYDDKNRLKSTIEVLGEDSYTYGYTYDEDNRISTITLNDSAREYTYDNYGRTSVLKTTNGSAPEEGETTPVIKTDTYAFTGSDNTTSSQIASHTLSYGGIDKTYSYTYDDNGNILTISDGTNTVTYEYDTANQLTKEINPAEGYVRTWTYDNAGNILERKEYEYVNDAQGELTATVTYAYGDEDGWGDLLTSCGGQAITYDAIGNPLSDGTRTYTWKHGRQLASLTMDGVIWNYTYNADGLRTSKSNGTLTYNYTYTGDKLTHLTDGTNQLYIAYDASGIPMSVDYNGTTYYYVTNVQGDVIGILNASGALVVSYTYDAWGNQLSCTGSLASTLGVHNPLRYRSYVYDSGSGLYYLQSRYYNPEIGRFLNTDAFTSTGQGLLGNNMFAYCNNNPIMHTDSTGCYPLQAAFEFLETWIKGGEDKQYYSEKSRIVKLLKKSNKMQSYIDAAIDDYKADNPTTFGTGEFTPGEDGHELYLSTQHFDYTITVAEEPRTVGILRWKHEEIRYTATVTVHDIYNFDSVREWNSFGNTMNNLAYMYSVLGGGHNFEWFATYTYTTKWTDVT